MKMKKYVDFLDEGIWSLPSNLEQQETAKTYVQKIEDMKNEIYDLLGDDILFDCLDKAIKRIHELIELSK
jgi:hypothetical protein